MNVRTEERKKDGIRRDRKNRMKQHPLSGFFDKANDRKQETISE